jgi:DNA-binding LytR/AlgR family response regulator
MRTFTCAAIDDEPLALRLIKGFIQRMPRLKPVGIFEDAIAGGEFIRHHPVDILFIDIRMPDISGLTLVGALSEKPQVIFTTAHKNFAYEGFELDAVDFLLKPIRFERFAKAVNKAIDAIGEKNIPVNDPEHFFVWSEYRQVKISAPQILYIESREDYVCIYLKEERPVLSLMPLKDIPGKLPLNKFIRIHRSYIIPISAIKEVYGKKVLLHCGKTLPIGSSYYHAFREMLKTRKT